MSDDPRHQPGVHAGHLAEIRDGEINVLGPVEFYVDPDGGWFVEGPDGTTITTDPTLDPAWHITPPEDQ